MTTEPGTLIGAVRAVLADATGPDMREVGRRAAALLDDDLVLAAAATHLASLARREWNRSVRNADGTVSADEVVVTGAAETFIGNTDAADREWLAANRERLAEGLLERADALRAWPSPTMAPTSAEVLGAERRARNLESLADALEQLVTAPTPDPRPAARERVAAARKVLDEIMPRAKVIAAGNWPGGQAAKLRRRIGRLAPVFTEAIHALDAAEKGLADER